MGYAALATLRWTGLRRNGISMLRLDGVDLDARRISLVGKGDKARIVPIAPPLVPILDHYLTSLRPALAKKSAFFFVNPSAQQGGRYDGRYGPMTVAKLVPRWNGRGGHPAPLSTTAGATPTPRASYAGEPTSTSSSASSATPTSPRRRGTSTSPTPTWPTPWTRRSPPSRATPRAASRGRRREQHDGGQIAAVRLGEHGVGPHLVVHERGRPFERLDLIGRVGRREGPDEVEPVGPVLGHCRWGYGPVDQRRGVVAQAFDHLGPEFVLLVEVVEEPLVDGVEIDDEELAHGISLLDRETRRLGEPSVQRGSYV